MNLISNTDVEKCQLIETDNNESVSLQWLQVSFYQSLYMWINIEYTHLSALA